jgi:hypothetical protein
MGRSKIAVFRELLEDEGRAQTANAAFEAVYARRIEAGETTALATAEDALTGRRHDERPPRRAPCRCGDRRGRAQRAHTREMLESAPHTHIVETVGDFAEIVGAVDPAAVPA